MLFPALEDELVHARQALDRANSESVIQLCQRYLKLLYDYRKELLNAPDVIDLDLRAVSSSSPEAIRNNRRSVRLAIETTTEERNRIEALLLAFTAVSGYSAVESLNLMKYRGHEDWELKASGVKRRDDVNGEILTVQEAVDTASLLRREAYIAQR